MNRTISAFVFIFSLLFSLLPCGIEQAYAQTSPDSVEVSAEDLAAQNRLNAIFKRIDALNGIRAEVASGVVLLTGVANETSHVDEAEELAKKMDGVIWVDADVEVQIDVAKRVAPAWEKTVELGSALTQRLPLIAIGLVVLVIFWFLAGFIGRRFPLRGLSDKPLAAEFSRNGIKAFIILIGLSITLEIWGIASLVAAFVGTAGIVSIGIGFAFKDVVENYLGGVLLGLRQPFYKDDHVDIAGFEGRVIRLTSRETILMTLDGNHLTIPNAMVFKSVLYNFSRNPLRRFDFTFGVAPDSEFRKIIPLGLETLGKTEGVLQEPPPLVRIESVGDYTLNIVFNAWVDQKENDFVAVKSEAIRRVNRAFLAAGIDMPEPMRRITIVDSEKPPTQVDELEISEEPMIDTSVDRSLDKQIDAADNSGIQ